MDPEHARELVAAVAKGPALVLVAPQAEAAAPAKVAVGLRASCGLLRPGCSGTGTGRPKKSGKALSLGWACLAGDLDCHIK